MHRLRMDMAARTLCGNVLCVWAKRGCSQEYENAKSANHSRSAASSEKRDACKEAEEEEEEEEEYKNAKDENNFPNGNTVNKNANQH